MKKVELSVAGKTFVAGEYLALQGGPALVLSTEPRFKLLASSEPSSKSQNPFHADSPAGLFWNEKIESFREWDIEFQDPYKIGGFGASSAQFALLHALFQLRENAFIEAERFFDWHEMLRDYRRIGSHSGRAPSGADVVGVCAGGLTLFDRNHGKVQTFGWPFQEIEFFVAHTGQKLATHTHLLSLQDFPTEEFERAMTHVQVGLSQVRFEEFLEGLSQYRKELHRQELVTPFTKEKVNRLQNDSRILFAKGCGAMGSDVVLVFCEKSHSTSVEKLIIDEGLVVVARSSQISSGLQIRTISKDPEVSL